MQLSESIAGRPAALAELVRGRAISARLAVVALGVLAAVSCAVRILLVRQVPAPFFFMDELGYEQMANNLARHGSLALFGNAGSTYAPLYSVVLAPVYALTRSAPQAYLWAKVVNAVLMSLSAFPVYAIARFVLSRPRALGVAALSLIAPLMFYTDLELSENLAYPLFLVAVWAMLHALSKPSPRRDALLLVSVAAASAARLQNVALLPAAISAVVLVSLVRPEGTRPRAFRHAARAHLVLFGVTTAACAAVLGRAATNGGSLPLAGRYAEVGRVHPGLLRVLKLAAQHLAAFDLALGVVPFAAALAAAYALARFGYPRRGLVFGSVALAVTVWLLLEVGYDAAAFDRDYVQRVGQQIPHDASRFHERYLIYLVPLFLVAMVAVLRAARPRLRGRVHVGVAAVAALVPLAIPFTLFVNDSTVAESFGLQVFAKNVQGTVLPFGHARLIAFAVAAVLALAYLYAFLRPRPSFAVVMTVLIFVIFSSVVRIRLIGASQTIAIPSSHARWVDRVVGGADAVLVSGGGARRDAVLETAFDNLRITRIAYACTPAFQSGFGEQPLAVDGSGRVVGGPTARYVVAPTALGVLGRVAARYEKGGLELVEAAGGILRFAPTGTAAGCGP